ncbi:hypothetical protein K469DRAFT_695763 [Zopfia rhizophila CBS 207.26]|uniref:Fungal N-terminal domain-containing protein n=1 Tax=Zopfia rhizophila CBS 207.26 TaxID=1314779 RepID=A0A6A6DFA9_9PEZI|nr:hypothetical protein K469DRAFT_695763 [Zopfia rhizophila CBS 207.26]
MSFGFSIGDIVLLSQLAYNLYSSVSAGRRNASRELKELEDVLFGLRCALDHLGEVAKDVLANPTNRPGGPDLKQNLNRMIESCGSTLQELALITKKYREMAITEDSESVAAPAKIRILEDFTKNLKVNWKKVRWDMEKQSLQQYRDKLRSHTDAINIILNSVLWSNANNMESSSRANHEKTHSLLSQALANPQTDPSLHQLVKEIHGLLIQPEPLVRSIRAQVAAPVAPMGSGFGNAFAGGLKASMGASAGPRIVMGKATPCSGPWAGPPGGPPVMTAAMIATDEVHMDADVRANAFARSMRGPIILESVAPPAETPGPISAPRDNLPAASSVPFKPQLPDRSVASSSQRKFQLPSSIVELNNMRQITALKEFQVFKLKYSKPTELVKPAFLYLQAPDLAQLREGLRYIFRPLPVGGTDQARIESHERKSEVVRWADGFSQYIKGVLRNNDQSHNGQVDLLVDLNGAIEKSDWKMRGLFYQASEQARLEEMLDRLQASLKSVRVMKEIEEFQDAKEEWVDSYEGG